MDIGNITLINTNYIWVKYARYEIVSEQQKLSLSRKLNKNEFALHTNV